jgi:hypothetical protein
VAAHRNGHRRLAQRQRHGNLAAVGHVLARVGADAGGAGSVLDATPVIVDRRSVLAATGLLAAEHPEAAAGLAEELLRSAGTVTPSGR